MLQRVSEQVGDCYQRAAEADEQADQSTDSKLKAELRRLAGIWRMLARSYEFQGSLGSFVSFNRGRETATTQIEACVIDVVQIAQQSQDFDQAMKRIERLFADSQCLTARHFALAQRVRDQLVRPKNEASGNCKICLDQVIGWLDHDHLGT
jgi:hypothetical protein